MVHHQNTLYTATAPAALYVAGILGDERSLRSVEKNPRSFPGPMRAELPGWLDSVANEADDEAAAISRHFGFPPEDYPPFVEMCRIRPQLFCATSAFLDDPDIHVPLGSVRPPTPTRQEVRGRRWQVTSWPSTKPDRRLGPGRVSEPPPDRPGMKPFPSELEPPEADRALETIDAATDNGPVSDGPLSDECLTTGPRHSLRPSCFGKKRFEGKGSRSRQVRCWLGEFDAPAYAHGRLGISRGL